MPKTVLIVDDHPSFRRTARALLESEGFEVVGEAEDGASAIEAARKLRPDVVLLDVQLPDMDGFAVADRSGRDEEPARRSPGSSGPRRRSSRSWSSAAGGGRVERARRRAFRGRAGERKLPLPPLVWNSMVESLTELVSASPWTYAVVLGFAALDAVFPVVPSETAAIAAGVLAGAGDPSIALVVAAAGAGAFLGDSSSYAIGRTAGQTASRPLFRGSKGRARREWAERTLDRRGGYLLVVARFVPGGRTATTLTAGITRMRWPRFVRFAALAAVLWASFAAGMGYLGGRAFEEEPWRGLVAALALAGTIILGVEIVRRLPRATPCRAC